MINNKYYVGKTDDVLRRFQEHLSGNGSEWTKKWKPLNIFDSKPNKDFLELATTLNYMKKYGIENVRGAEYSRLVLTKEQNKEIIRHINHEKDLCFRCGQSDHYIKNCQKKETELSLFSKIIFLLFARCFYKPYPVVMFGRHNGKTYEEVWQNHRNYCDWILQTESKTKSFNEFKNWCKLKI